MCVFAQTFDEIAMPNLFSIMNDAISRTNECQIFTNVTDILRLWTRRHSQVGVILICFIFSGQFWHPVDLKQLEICN